MNAKTEAAMPRGWNTDQGILLLSVREEVFEEHQSYRDRRAGRPPRVVGTYVTEVYPLAWLHFELDGGFSV